MRRASMLSLLALILCGLLGSEVADAGRVYVRGYFRSDGTYVPAHYRTVPDGNFWNNWSTYPNVNPYTGKIGTRRIPSLWKYTAPRMRSYSPGLGSWLRRESWSPYRSRDHLNYSDLFGSSRSRSSWFDFDSDGGSAGGSSWYDGHEYDDYELDTGEDSSWDWDLDP